MGMPSMRHVATMSNPTSGESPQGTGQGAFCRMNNNESSLFPDPFFETGVEVFLVVDDAESRSLIFLGREMWGNREDNQ
jgi:hypothetical protein